MVNGFSQKVTQIKGLSDRRRLPRLGVIRLGLKAKSKQSGKEYPTEVSYFVCPPDVQKIFGEKPTEIEVMLPINDINAVFPQAYKMYGSSKGLKCQGDGETAYRVNEESKEMEQIPCPCDCLESGKCKQTGTLMVMIPKVSVGGIYQLRTSSYNSIVDINSGLDYCSALIGRFAMIPLTLRRVKTETHHDEKKQNHYTLQIIFDGNIDTINALRTDTQRVLEHPRFALPPAEDISPEAGPVDIIIDEEQQEPSGEPTPAPADGKPSDNQLADFDIWLKDNGYKTWAAVQILVKKKTGKGVNKIEDLTIEDIAKTVSKNGN